MNMKFLIVDITKRLGDKSKPQYAVQRLADELEKRGIDYDLANYADIVLLTRDNSFDIKIKGKSIDEYSHIIMRGHRTAYEYMLKLHVVAYAEKNNIVVQNSHFMKMWPQYNKLIQMQFLTDAGLPYIPSAYCIDGRYWEKVELLEQLGLPLIYKHIEGEYKIEIIDGKEKFKKNVYPVNSIEELKKVCQEHDDIEKTFTTKPSKYFIQKYISTGTDYRLIIIGGKYYSGWKRDATRSFLTVNHGEYSLYDKPDPSMLDIAVKTAQILSADYCAVDIMPDNGIPYILEVNMNPGFKSFETKISGTPTDIASEIIEQLLSKK